MNSPILNPVATTASTTTVLSTEDTALLHSLEKRVATSSLDCFTALAEINEYKGGLLWKATHTSFEEYVRERFNYKPQHLGRLLGAGNLTLQLKSKMEKPEDLPINEAQLRPLLNKLPESHQVQAWKKVVAELKPEERTGARVMAKVQEIRKAIPKEELAASKPARAPKVSKISKVIQAPAPLETPEELIQKLLTATASHRQVFNIHSLLQEIIRLMSDDSIPVTTLSSVDNKTGAPAAI
ncbi:MAG: hypothetical protein WCP60_10355 [bacterium]